MPKTKDFMVTVIVKTPNGTEFTGPTIAMDAAAAMNLVTYRMPDQPKRIGKKRGWPKGRKRGPRKKAAPEQA